MKSVLLLRDPATPAEVKAWSEFDAASRKIKAAQVAAKGGTGTEDSYKIAYQALAREGLVSKLKKKYRG